MTRPDGGTEKMAYTTIPLGLLGLPWSDLTKKAWDQTLTHLRLPGLKLGDDSRNTPLLHLVVVLQSLALTNSWSLKDFPLRYDIP